MADEVEYRCFVGNLSWSTSDRGLKAAFEKFGNLLEAKLARTAVVIEKETGRSRGFGFVTFDEKLAMDKAIEAMNGIDLDGRNITVDKSSSNQGSGRDYDDNRSRDRSRGRDHDRGRDFGRGRGGGGGGGGGGECFKCGKPGHFARECPSDGASGGRYGGRDDRHGGRDDRYGGRDDRYGGSGGSRGGSRYGPDRNGDRFSGRNRDNGAHGGGDRYGRDRAGPYDRRGAGGY